MQQTISLYFQRLVIEAKFVITRNHQTSFADPDLIGSVFPDRGSQITPTNKKKSEIYFFAPGTGKIFVEIINEEDGNFWVYKKCFVRYCQTL
jgi:hypothetical protein